MSGGTRAKKRLTYKRQMDKNDAIRQREKSLSAQKMDLQAEVGAGKLELEHANVTCEERVRQFEAIKAFYKEHFGRIKDLRRTEEQAAEVLDEDEIQSQSNRSYVLILRTDRS
jgi:hypothetical protein